MLSHDCAFAAGAWDQQSAPASDLKAHDYLMRFLSFFIFLFFLLFSPATHGITLLQHQLFFNLLALVQRCRLRIHQQPSNVPDCCVVLLFFTLLLVFVILF